MKEVDANPNDHVDLAKYAGGAAASGRRRRRTRARPR